MCIKKGEVELIGLRDISHIHVFHLPYILWKTQSYWTYFKTWRLWHVFCFMNCVLMGFSLKSKFEYYHSFCQIHDNIFCSCRPYRGDSRLPKLCHPSSVIWRILQHCHLLLPSTKGGWIAVRHAGGEMRPKTEQRLKNRQWNLAHEITKSTLKKRSKNVETQMLLNCIPRKGTLRFLFYIIELSIAPICRSSRLIEIILILDSELDRATIYSILVIRIVVNSCHS